MKRALPLLLAACVAGCAASGPVADLAPGERPALATDEAGLWLATDAIEARLKTSGRRLADPALEAYLHGIACRLSPEHCAAVRIYVMELPHFNASIMPNGAMQVWSGLLLRVDNEAQLAAVIGHELAHFERRHTLQRWRDLRRKAAWSEVVGTLGGDLIGTVGQAAMMMSVMAYSREQEREADALGLARLPPAGYDAREAARVWQLVIDEQRRSDEPRGSIFLASHPTPPERLETLTALAAQQPPPATRQDRVEPGLAAAIAPHRSRWLRDELRRQKPAETEWLIERLFARSPGDPELHFARGELRRLRAGPGDLQAAVEDYRRALAAPDPPPLVWRSLGTALAQLQQRVAARDALAIYLELAPDAPDAPMIRTMIEGMS